MTTPTFALRPRAAALAASGLTLLTTVAAHAEEAAPVVDSGDTAWVLTASALVLMMTLPGLALFYGGLVRAQERPATFSCRASSCAASSACCGSSSATAWPSAPATRSSAASRRSVLNGVALESVDGELRDAAAEHPRVRSSSCSRRMFAIITPALILGRHRRADEVPRLGRVHLLWLVARLLPDRAHGVGRRRAGSSRLGRDRLRGRPGRAHVERLLGARRCG